MRNMHKDTSAISGVGVLISLADETQTWLVDYSFHAEDETCQLQTKDNTVPQDGYYKLVMQGYSPMRLQKIEGKYRRLPER
jgi:hypothetical protein